MTTYEPYNAQDATDAGGPARDCGDFADHCQSGYTFFRRGTSTRSTADQYDAQHEWIYIVYDASKPGTEVDTGTSYGSLLPKAIRRFRVTTDSCKTKASPNLINRDFTSKHPNALWLSDITYIPTRQGWLYLAAVLDAHSRAVVGWAMSRTLDTKLAMAALNRAITHRGPPLTLHSDQGSTYATGSYREIVNRYGIRQSMSRKGDCWDNAPMESFFHTLKTELVMHCDYKTRDDARASLFDYMEVFYNRQRRHSSIGYKAPLPFEAMKSPGKVSTVRG